MSRARDWRFQVFLALFIGALLYGTSYQQFRHFDLSDPHGITDSRSYVRMSHGDYDVPSVHRSRFVVPLLVSWVRPATALLTSNESSQDLISFYLVNFTLLAATAFVFFYLLRGYGFRNLQSLLGVAIFLSSRMSVISAGTPMVDSIYYLAIVCILLGMQRDRLDLLAWSYPLMILTKETTVPFMLLPLLMPSPHRLRLALMFVVSLGVAYASRSYIADLASPGHQEALMQVIVYHLSKVWATVLSLPTLETLHNLQNGFSFFLVIAAGGFAVARQMPQYRIPPLHLLIVPIAFFYALLSGNLGRMLFAACFVIIPYALIGIDWAVHRFGDEAEPAT